METAKTSIPKSSQPDFSELLKRGTEIYESLRLKLEATNLGEYVAIDFDSGSHFLGSTRDEAIEKARASVGKKVLFARRIGDTEKSNRHRNYTHRKYARVF